MSALIASYWVHDLDPFLIRFGDSFGIRYYGLAYVFGFLSAWGLLIWYHKKGRSPLNPEQVSDVFFAVIVGVLVGGRLGYFLFYRSADLVGEPFALLRVWEGGMASHGGFLGGIAAILWASRKTGVSFLRIADLLATAAPPGLFFGRVANFINGELWGKITTVPWAVRFPQSVSPGTAHADIPPRHPSQLYEAGLEGLALFIYLQIRFWKSEVVRKYPGCLGGEFLAGYAIARIFSELFREPDAALILGMNRGIFYSLFMLAAGIAVIVYTRRRSF